jgi:sulfite reductase beta subunit-like hemoprotein
MTPVSTETAIPDVVKKEIAHFKDTAMGFEMGTVADNDFKPFRLTHGIYGQRQKGVQMIRIKLPGGQVNPTQMRRLSSVVREYAPLGIGHVTTRQCVQIHFVKLELVPDVMTRLAEVDITTREACGNAIRNITCSPVAGLAGDEIFDPYPYARAVFKHFLRRPEYANLPRKFKMSFNGSPRDYSQAAINDIGFYSQVRIVDGKPVRGFRMKVGGGLGSSPQDAWLYNEFVPVDEIASHVEAILTHFNRDGQRKNRMTARIKFLIRKEGFDTFLSEVGKIYATLPKKVELPLDPEVADPVGDPNAKAPASGPEGYADWFKFNTWPQKQKGFRYAIIKLTLGDLTADQFSQMAGLMEKYGQGDLRFTNDQNLLLPWLKEDKLAEAYAELKAIGLADLGPDLIGDVTSCPGADTCNLGVTSSRSLGRVLTEHLAFHKDQNADLKGTHIKISGCPNSCGQHHVATLGFFGAIRRAADPARPEGPQDVPLFNVLIGGGIDESGATFGRNIAKVPSRRIKKVIDVLVGAYRKERSEGETFESWTRRVDAGHAVELIEPLTEVMSGDPELFKDNGSEGYYKLEGMGASECA